MKTLVRLGSLILVSVLAGNSVFAQGTTPSQQKLYSAPPILNAASSGKLKPGHLGSYFVGYNLMFARYLLILGNTANAVDRLKIVSMALSGQDEPLMQSCLRMIRNGEGTVEQIDEMLSTIQSNFAGKLNGDKRWFYDVGKEYARFFITLDYLQKTKDAGPLRQALINLGNLAKNAPSDVPTQVVSSLANLGSIGAKNRIEVDDVVAIQRFVTEIHKAMVV